MKTTLSNNNTIGRIIISLFVVACCLLSISNSSAQSPTGAAINTTGSSPDVSAILDVSATNLGFLMPRMTAVQKNAIVNPANGLLVYQTDSTKGIYIYDVNHWTIVGGASTSNLNFTFTTDLNYVYVPAGMNIDAPPITLTSTAISGNLNPINLGISGLPIGVTYTLSPGGGYPVPVLNSALILHVVSTLPIGSYPFTITATGGMTPKIINLTLKVAVAKKVFVTSTTYNGAFGGLSGGDAICQARASAAGLTGTYKAWLSTSSVDAKTRITDAPYIRTGDGLMIAGGIGDLTDGSILNTLSYDEFGNNQGSGHAWTGTIISGTVSQNHCTNWTSTSGNGMEGNYGWINNIWTYNYDDACSSSDRLYCFQQ